MSYGRPSVAGPNWNAYCNDYCSGQVRWLVCSFIDYSDYPYGVDDESVCNENNLDEWGNPYTSAYSYFWHSCQAESGTSTFYFGFSCTDAPTQGNFTCTFDDLYNCGP